MNNRVLSVGVQHYKLCDLTDDDMDRLETSNYTTQFTIGSLEVQLPWEGQVQAQIKQKLKHHAGELRSWPTSHHDTWRRMRIGAHHQPTSATVGHGFTGTWIGATIAERVAASGAHWDSAWDPIFSAQHQLGKEDGCEPNLDNAISTLAVWDKDGQHICLRAQHGVTLAEVFDEFGTHENYRTLLDEWLKGSLLIRRKPPRGLRGSGSGRKYATWRPDR